RASPRRENSPSLRNGLLTYERCRRFPIVPEGNPRREYSTLGRWQWRSSPAPTEDAAPTRSCSTDTEDPPHLFEDLMAAGGGRALLRWAWALGVALALGVGGASALRCPREPSPDITRALRSPGDRGYRILISGEPDYYVPDAVYTLSLLGSRTHGRLQMFSRFLLTAEPADPRADATPQRVGTFQLFGDSFTTFHDDCINTVAEANDLPKTEVQAMWTAPPRGSGCIVFRAMVLENVDNWWADDGNLSHRLCELPQDTQTGHDDSNECCACDEAKYQLVFEGLWSNVTHPKDFPFSLWLTHFSDVIGASHERNFSFWGEGQIASDGVRMVAEWGSVRGLEQELRASARHLRTLIKAGGLWYPNVNANTSTNFRVDQRRPLLSIISMLGPTPDWIVGVSGLNLCTRDCRWVERKTSPNSPTIPREKIRRITTMYPEDPRAPFYDPTRAEMLPLARLYLVRESVTPRPCGADDGANPDLAIEETDNVEDSARPECAVSDYSEWSPCSVSCGKGLRMRQRSYLMPDKAAMLGCGRQLLAKEMCVAQVCMMEADPGPCRGYFERWHFEARKGMCVPFGYGGCRGNRNNFMTQEECAQACSIMLGGPLPSAHAVQADNFEQPVNCVVSAWGQWSPCTSTCGKGSQLRTRTVLVEPRNGGKPCPKRLFRKKKCHLPSCEQ
ncbi:Kunitz-type serine protease inhibitor Bt-KTI, partial [Gryllus bimaculatus]